MADTSIKVTPGNTSSDVSVDMRTVDGGDARQVIVIGDPATNANVAPVSATNGLSVDNKTLPPLAATATKQSDGTQKTQIVDGTGNVVGSTTNALDVNVKSGSLTATIDVSTLATGAKQDTGNTSLSNIDTNQGAKADTAASTDTGTFSLIALFKRLLQGITTITGTISGGKLLTTETSASAIKTDLDTLVTNTTAIATAANQSTANGSLASIKTDVDTLATSGGGGYVRQDTTATIAKESGGNLASIKTDADSIVAQTSHLPSSLGQTTNSASLPVAVASDSGLATASNQTTGNSSLSTIVTNTGNGSTSANQTNGTQQSKLTDGTNIANTLKSDGTAAGQNSLQVSGSRQELSFTTTTTGAQVLLASTDVSNYRYALLQLTSAGASLAYTIQGSNDNSTYISIPVRNIANQANLWSNGNQGTTLSLFEIILSFRYVQINVTAMASGTTSGKLELFTVPPPLMAQEAIQAGTWTVGSNSATGSAAPANGFYISGINSSGNLTGIATIDRPNDAATGSAILATGNVVYNGTNFDRTRSATSAAATTGTGLLGVGALVFDGTNYQRITTNSTTYTSKNGADANLLGTLGTAFSTAGKVDVKGNDGDVFVRQTTGSNLVTNATLQTQTDTVMVGGVNVKEINGVTPLMGNGATGTGSQRVTLSSDNTAVANWGQGATGAAVPSGSQYNGGVAKTSLPTAATDGNLTGVMLDKFGRQVVVTNGIRDIVGSQTTTISASTSETTIGTAVASTFLDLTAVKVSNTSATAARVDFRDTTSGSVIFDLYVPAGDTRGMVFSTPQPQTTVNTNWTAQSSASVTDLRIFIQFVKNM